MSYMKVLYWLSPGGSWPDIHYTGVGSVQYRQDMQNILGPDMHIHNTISMCPYNFLAFLIT